MKLQILPVTGIPMVQAGNDLPALLFAALDREPSCHNGDILVVCQKVVSKAEGRLVDLRTITPSAFARQLSAQTAEGKDPRVIEVILGETKRIVRMDSGHLIVETGPGWVCANAGVDESNSGDANTVVLLPIDPDASAARIARAAHTRYAATIAVLITDTFGRPWRQGLVDFALGVAGMSALLDLRGTDDLDGRTLKHTIAAHADALAAAAGLVMRKGDGIPAAVVRGYEFTPAEGAGTELIREKQFDLFR